MFPVSVFPSSPRPSVARGLSAAAAITAALALAGCSGGSGDEPGGDSSSSSSGGSQSPASTSSGVPDPTGFDLPDGVTLTEAGSELSLGEPATVAVEPARARGSAVTLTVEEIQRGRTSDLSDYVLSDRAKKSTPFYVDVTVTNDGPGDLGGYAVPLYGQFDDDAIVENTSFATPFQRCDSAGLPQRFGPGKSYEGCLVFLIPDSGELQGVAFARAGFEPIAWSGSITPPAQQGGGSKNSDG